MSKFYNIEGQSVVVEGVLTESIGKSNSSPAPMTIADFAKTHKVDAYIKKPTEETVKKAEKELGVKFGPQLKNYLMTYGGLSYKFIEFEGLAENSDRIVTITKNVRSLGLDKKFIVVYKIHDEGAYACVDSSDKVYEVEIYAGKVTVKDMKMKFEDYFIYTMKHFKLLNEAALIEPDNLRIYKAKIKIFGKACVGPICGDKMEPADLDALEKKIKTNEDSIISKIIAFVKKAYNKDISESDVKSLSFDEIVNEGNYPVAVVFKKDKWTNSGIGIEFGKEIKVMDADNFY